MISAVLISPHLEASARVMTQRGEGRGRGLHDMNRVPKLPVNLLRQ